MQKVSVGQYTILFDPCFQEIHKGDAMVLSAIPNDAGNWVLRCAEPKEALRALYALRLAGIPVGPWAFAELRRLGGHWRAGATCSTIGGPP